MGEIATLSRHIEDSKEDYRDSFSYQASVNSGGWNARNFQAFAQEADEVDAAANDPVVASAADAANAFMANRKSIESNTAVDNNTSIGTVKSFESVRSNPEFSESQQMEMAKLLDAWEEPQTAEEKEVG